MKLLVTGGAGYIGSIVAQRLLDAGHEVVVLDNLTRGHREAVPEGARLVEADLLDPPALTEARRRGLRRRAALRGALARRRVGRAAPSCYWRNNVVGTLNLLDALRAAGVERLVFSSTAATYGEPEIVPIEETAPHAPGQPYGASKLAVDRMIADECRAHGLGAVSLRYFNVAGASGCLGEDHHPETHLIPNVLRAAQGLQPEVADLRHRLPDAATAPPCATTSTSRTSRRAHLLALDGARPGEHRIFNLGNGNGFSVREVIEAARAVTGHEIPRQRRRAAPATRRCSSPRASGSAPSWAGSRASRRSPTWSATRGRSRRRTRAATRAEPSRPRLRAAHRDRRQRRFRENPLLWGTD